MNHLSIENHYLNVNHYKIETYYEHEIFKYYLNFILIIKMKNIDKLIWNDLNEEKHVCPHCHQRMRQRKNIIDSWYCPNKKCKGGI